jgi:tetratricopeptide (TPR) repeat protein
VIEMLTILFCFIFIAALLSGLIFGGSMIWSLLAAVISLAFLVFRLVFAKKIKPLFVRLLSCLGVAILLFVGLSGGLASAESGYLAYDVSMNEITALLNQGDAFKAVDRLAEQEKQYGTNDAIQLQKARAAINKKEYDNALSALSLVSNKQLDQYYIVLGQVYLLQKKYDLVQSTYIEAARYYPLWSKAQQIAGTQAVNNKNYVVGEYFLLRTFEQVPTDPIPLYYIGVIRFEQGNYTQAEAYFSEAEDLGLSNELASYVAWYRQKMGGGQS